MKDGTSRRMVGGRPDDCPPLHLREAGWTQNEVSGLLQSTDTPSRGPMQQPGGLVAPSKQQRMFSQCGRGRVTARGGARRLTLRVVSFRLVRSAAHKLVHQWRDNRPRFPDPFLVCRVPLQAPKLPYAGFRGAGFKSLKHGVA